MNKQIVLIITPFLLLNLTVNSQNSDFKRMVEYATKAPSGHNTQPWIFRIKESVIEIHPDFSKALPVVDGNHRELYISLGCAVENLCIAANEFGYTTDVTVDVDAEEQTFIRIEVATGNSEKSILFEQIDKRQTNRSMYNNKLIPADTINELERKLVVDDVNIQFYEKNSRDFNVLKDLVAEGNTIQMNDKAFKAELLDWIRFNKKQVEEVKDGLTYEVMGTPATPGFVGKPIVKSFLKPTRQNKSDMEKINSSSHLVLFTIAQNDAEDWINLGRVLERFLLETTRMGIANAYLNQPCEVESVSITLRSALDTENFHPALLLRIGYANPLPYSPRKDVAEVIK